MTHPLERALLLVLLGWTASFCVQGWTPQQGVPPSGIGRHVSTLRFTARAIEGRVSVATFQKAVSVDWRHTPSLAGASQQLKTTYWPTWAQALSGSTLLVVGGKRPNGNTLIETWKFREPRMVYPLPGHPGPRGEGAPYLDSATVHAKNTVYESAAQGRDGVHRMFPKIADPEGLLVQFSDSKDVYDFDLGRDPVRFERIASPCEGGDGVMLIPSLSELHSDTWSADHLDFGYVYMFSGSEPLLALVDGNRDGVVDGHLLITAEDWVRSGWGDGAKYRHRW